VASSPDATYFAVLGILLTLAGAGLKYFVRDFFQMPDTLHTKYSTAMTEAHATIHERRFLPTLVQIYDQVAVRKGFLPAASTTDILMELPIDAQVREAMAAVSERNSLDRAFGRAAWLSPCVAISSLFVICSSVALFFVIHHAPSGWKTTCTWGLILTIVSASVAGLIFFGLFWRASYKLSRLLRGNRF
jgi:hypothetical protein